MECISTAERDKQSAVRRASQLTRAGASLAKPLQCDNYVVVLTHNHCERQVVDRLTAQGLNPYNPRLLEWRHGTLRVKPFLPGAVLLAPPWHDRGLIEQQDGVIGLLCATQCGPPVLVPASFVAAIRARELDGVVRLDSEPPKRLSDSLFQPMRGTARLALLPSMMAWICYVDREAA